MSRTSLFRGLGVGLILAVLSGEPLLAEPQEKPKEPAKPMKAEIGPNVFFEQDGDKRRVLITATVCLREGKLEHLLSRTKAEKQHESILTSDLDARHIHAALIACRVNPGTPVQFVNEKWEREYKAATGPKIKVLVQYEEKGKTVTVPAQKWIRDAKTKKELAVDWIFTGSKLFPDPNDPKKPPYYGANDGRVICVSNFTTALLDLPIESSDKTEDLLFEPNKEIIPPLETKVTVILEPMPKEKK